MASPSQLQIITDLPRLPARSADSNKGMYGRVLVVAGSKGMSGAAVLSGKRGFAGRRGPGARRLSARDPAHCRGGQPMLHDRCAGSGCRGPA